MRTLVLLPDRNYIFEPSFPGVYTYLIDATLPFVYVKNDINEAKVIPPKLYLGIVIEYNIEFYYIALPNDYIYIASKVDIKVNTSDRGYKVKT